MTKHRLLFGACVLLAGAELSRSVRAQDAAAQSAQQIQMQTQQAIQSSQSSDQIQQQAWLQQQWALNQAALQSQGRSCDCVAEHLQVGQQTFDASVAGLRAYLETTKSSDPSLYERFNPDVARLESKQKVAEVAFLGGVSFSFSLAAGDTGRSTLTALGTGALLAGSLIALFNWPGRKELLKVIEKHNRGSAHPLHLQLGYGGAAVAF